MPKWFQIVAKAKEEPTEILIYDQIGKDWFSQDGVSAKEFAAALKDIPQDKEIVVCINSPGGNVFDGLAIYHQLQARKDKVFCRVDGVAASIASVIALAGRELQMPENAMLMVHDPTGLVVGNSKEMREMADLLDKHADNLADVYAKKTGKTRTEMRDLMRSETWMNGVEAKEQGFADVVTEAVKMAASVIGRVLSHFRNAVKPAIQSGDNPPKMNKAQIIALLKKHGATVADDATEEQLLAQLDIVLQAKAKTEPEPKPEPKPEPEPKPDDDKVVNLNTIRAKLEAQERRFEQERIKRVTAEFNAIMATRPQIEAKAWLPRVLADETILNDLRAMPEYGTDPVALGATKDLGNPAMEEYRKMKAGAERNKFRIDNFETLQKVQRQLQPRAANTLAAALVPDFLADALVTVAFNKLAPLAAFSRDFGTDPIKPRSTVQVRKATTGGAAVDNPTNFESGDTTVNAIAVAVNQVSKSFHITNDELNKGHRLAHLAELSALIFSDALSDDWTALLIAANYPTPLVIGAASAFDSADLPPIWEAAKNFKSRNLILDGSHLARLLPVDKFKFAFGESGAFGFDRIDMQNRWTGAVVNTVGFVCGPDAIAVAAGLPIQPPNGEFLSMGTVTLEGLGLSVQTCSWFSRAGRVNWASYDVIFGAAAGDTGQGEILVTA